MNVFLTLALALQLLTALGMIGLILVQHGKGADMGAAFGSGSSGSLFGATGSANFLSKTTAVLATVFFITTLALAYFGNNAARPASSGGSVLERAAVTAPATAPAASGVAAVAASGAAAAASASNSASQIPTGASTAPATPAAQAASAGAAAAVKAASGVGQIPTK